MRNTLRRITQAAVIATATAVVSAIPVYAASATTYRAINTPHVSTVHVKSPGLNASEVATATHICLTHDLDLCMKSNGEGNQVTITSNSADYMDIRTVASVTCVLPGGTQGFPCYQFEDGGGNCLRAGTNNVVLIGNGGCLGGDFTDWWVNTSANVFKSREYANTLLTHGDTNGFNVWHATPGTGDWDHWSFKTTS